MLKNPHYIPEMNPVPDDSLCRGAKGAKICETCQRLSPGPKKANYLLVEPVTAKGTCCRSYLKMGRNIE